MSGAASAELIERNTIAVGDACQRMAELAPRSVDMIVTSPPYFRLRDYQVAGQLGLEHHVDQWVAKIGAVATEASRVLVDSGSLWLNLADTYSTHPSQGADKKSLLLGPERVALSLISDGWLLRNKIIWHKPNPMPTSVRDRLNTTWEAIYVFTKQPNYFFDLDSIREPHQSQTYARARRSKRPNYRRPPTRERWRGPNGDDASGLALLKAQGQAGHPLGKNPGDVWRIGSSAFRGGHHATFPVALVEKAITAGCPEARCSACQQPWTRNLVRSLGHVATRQSLAASCQCQAESEPGLVLDPFMGAGTTAVAAEQSGREWVGVELNPIFAAIARKRIVDSRPSPP